MNNITFDLITKTLPQKGNLVYEYNAFRNYRLNSTKFLYNNILYSEEELIEKGILKLVGGKYDYTFSHLQEKPEPYESGLVIDFDTSELNFDLKHPVQITPLYSYDGSVNLILNDGKNLPKLINSRFSPLGKNLYLIVDRKGDSDTNIYDEGDQFDIDTSLYKRTIEIPTLTFNNVLYGGNLSIGNYHFYFKYADADGNETDFVLESGLVSIFIGNSPSSIRSGFRNENSHKMVTFTIKNIDSAYLYVNVYYSKATSDINLNETKSAFKIDTKYIVKDNLTCVVVITGFENTTEIPLEDLNLLYLICGSVETLTTALNMLFLGNVRKPEIQYKELTDISLRFLPLLKVEYYPLIIDKNYNINSNSYGYYDPKYIYSKTGYWYNEIYRFGIVYIMSDNTLSPVFNVRGKLDVILDDTNYSDFKLFIDEDKRIREYINYKEDNYEIISENSQLLENAKGVISIKLDNVNKQKIIGINFSVSKEVIDYLKNTLKVKGFFFVRLKRIPTTLCLAFKIGIDPESNTPVIPTNKGYITESFISKKERLLTNDCSDRFVKVKDGLVRKQAAICPDYDINSPYYNSLFNGSEFIVLESKFNYSNKTLIQDVNYSDRHFYIELNNNIKQDSQQYYKSKILGIEDNVKLLEVGRNKFSARAGEAEEAFRFEFIEYPNKGSEATNLLRGSYGPYLAITNTEQLEGIIDIKIPGYTSADISNYFKIRYDDKSTYYAISERISLSRIDTELVLKDNDYTLLNDLYRGDCYICLFSHRINRNFQDPAAPINDEIVDKNTWKDNFEYKDGVLNKEKFNDINLGDVNAVLLGMWVTFTVRSNYNLNIRNTDSSIPDEVALTGHARGFYPYNSISARGSYKTPEALCFNKGFGVGLSERWNFEAPDVPAIKNDFTNRILYSDIHITDAFLNGFRVFRGQHYKDYPKTYGLITKIVELSGNLLVVFEHGIGLIAVNERTVAGEGTGGNVYINTSNVLPDNPNIISDTVGSLWKESIIKTPMGVYGVDTIAKKIWFTNGNLIRYISDNKVQEFLNNNISLTERELEPIIGIRNVKTHYNKFKGDVMFTFYDNLHGFEEKVWNLCYNEYNQNFVTFYSWLPSYSENIYNQFFTFDRNTSKWIAKLGVSNSDNNFSDGVVLDDNIIKKDSKLIGKLSLANRNLPTGDDVECKISYFLERDNYRNDLKFEIKGDSLYYKEDYINYCSELFVRCKKDNNNKWLLDTKIEVPKDSSLWKDYVLNLTPYYIYKDDRGRRLNLSSSDPDNRINSDKIVWLLNIKAVVEIIHKNKIPTLAEAQSQGFVNGVAVDGTQYLSIVAVIPEYNKLFLTTDFWKHGQAGIIDITDKIYPTYWYGKQHPFEFEFVVLDNPDKHKIFDNLLIISNNAAPESFHYEIIGDCFEFAKDKKNMYIRQEATKELYLYNGSDILYNKDYKELDSSHRPLSKYNNDNFDKSTILPLYYYRKDTINEIEDYYHLHGYLEEYSREDKNYSALAGAEIVRYPNLNEYRIWNHAKAVDIRDEGGRIRGNMLYKEDIWNVLINPINLVLKNETKEDWKNIYKLNTSDLDTYNQVPAELGLFKEFEDSEGRVIKTNNGNLELPNDWTRNVVSWKEYESLNKEVKIKDKFMKVRIRYSGEDLAIISAVRTLYSISYG